MRRRSDKAGSQPGSLLSHAMTGIVGSRHAFSSGHTLQNASALLMRTGRCAIAATENGLFLEEAHQGHDPGR